MGSVSLCNTLIDGFALSAEYTKDQLSTATDNIRQLLGGDSDSMFSGLENTRVNDPVGGSAQTEAESEPVSSEGNWMNRKMRGAKGVSLGDATEYSPCLLYTSPSPRDA